MTKTLLAAVVLGFAFAMPSVAADTPENAASEAGKKFDYSDAKGETQSGAVDATAKGQLGATAGIDADATSAAPERARQAPPAPKTQKKGSVVWLADMLYGALGGMGIATAISINAFGLSTLFTAMGVGLAAGAAFGLWFFSTHSENQRGESPVDKLGKKWFGDAW